jgi:hypothetical protein
VLVYNGCVFIQATDAANAACSFFAEFTSRVICARAITSSSLIDTSTNYLEIGIGNSEILNLLFQSAYCKCLLCHFSTKAYDQPLKLFSFLAVASFKAIDNK